MTGKQEVTRTSVELVLTTRLCFAIAGNWDNDQEQHAEGREKPSVLGEVEVHAADEIPRGVAVSQKLLDAALRFG